MSREGASQREKIQHSASRGELFSPTENDNSYITKGSSIAYAVATAPPLPQPSSLTKSLSKLSIRYPWPHISGRGIPKAVNCPDKTKIPVSSSSVTNGTDSIDGIDVQG